MAFRGCDESQSSSTTKESATLFVQINKTYLREESRLDCKEARC